MNDKPNKQHEQRLIVVLVLLLLALCAANLWFGSVQIPASAVWDILCGKEPEKEVWKFIVLESRLPQMVAALLSGAALAVAGLLLQTAFNNPLAGPSILGIDTGASLGVALVMLFWGGTLGVSEATTLTGFTAVIAGAFLGSVTVLGTILFFSTIVKNNIMLLIVGIMVGYILRRLSLYSTISQRPKGYTPIRFGAWEISAESPASSYPISHFSYLSDLSSQYF